MSTWLSSSLLGIIMISALPIVGWIYFWYRNHPLKRSYVVLTFIAGMLAVVPIKLYELYWNQAILFVEHINIISHLSALANSPSLGTLLAFIFVHTVVTLMLFMFVALMMFILEVGSGDNTVAIFRRKFTIIAESPFFFISIGILCGLVAYGFSSTVISVGVWLFIVVGMIEEFTKHLIVRFSDEFKITSIADAIQFSIIVALGFAFVENIIYLYKYHQTAAHLLPTFMILVFLRSTVSVLAHVSFSAILGYFYGLSRYAKEICSADIQRPLLIRWAHKMLHLKTCTLFREEKMMEGMLLAMMAHAAFNAALDYNAIAPIILLIIISVVVICSLFHQSSTSFINLIRPNYQ